MTRRYDVRSGMLENDPDAGQPREQLVPGWRVPGNSRYDLRIGDAERDATMTLLREHFAAGRLTFDELTERIDLALAAKTQGQIENLMADLPRLPRTPAAQSDQPGFDHDAGRFVVLRAAAVRDGHLDADDGVDVTSRRLRAVSVPGPGALAQVRRWPASATAPRGSGSQGRPGRRPPGCR